jgi:serine/threonine-protein kinase
VQEGTQVGAYRLLHQIGSGGMGAVWLAEHSMLGRRAAVKVLHGEFTSRSEIVQRFFNEARAATAISDPGIVQVFDFGQHTDGTAYIVMELLEGQGLDQRVREHGPMLPADALRIIRQIAKSLGAAHTRGIVHRDLKPENIFLVRDDEVAGGERAKILDFGIAKLQGDTQGWRTNTSQVMGTPLYMSPEQCRGAGQVDQRTDIYSMGCLLFVLLTGRPPFWAEGSGELIAMHLREAPPHASQFNVRVPPSVDALITRCLAKDPAARYLNGIELANAASEVLAGLSTEVPRANTPAPVAAAIVGNAATTLSSSTGMVAAAHTAAAEEPRRPRALMLAGGIAVFAVAAGVAGFALSRRQPPSRPVVASGTAQPTPAGMPPVDAAAAVTPPVIDAPAATPTAPDPRGQIATRMVQVINGFLRWSATHAGAACPTPKDLAPQKLDDPWGHPMRLTCTDQPSNQMIGIVSSGPDGIAGNRDDIASWTLPGDVSEAIAGPRWTARRASTPPPNRGSGARTGGTTGSAAAPTDLDGDGIPDVRTK